MATDELDGMTTDELLWLCDRLTPAGDRAAWVVTSADRYTADGADTRFTREELREFALEQARVLRLTRAQWLRVRS